MRDAYEFTAITSSVGWNALFGFTDGASSILILPLAFTVFFLCILFPLYFILGFTERKLAADLQARVGPNRTPGNGIFQTFADTLKLGSKSVTRHDSSLNPRWFALQNAILYSTFVFLPFGSELIFLDSDISVFLPFVTLGAVFLCTLFASEGSEELENEIRVHRGSFLWISAWIPALIAVITSTARVGSARWTNILSAQSHGILTWTAFSSPFGFVAFFVFLLSGLVALRLPPFHALDRDVRNRSGTRLALFGLNEFFATFVWCLLAVGLFLGGQEKRDPVDVSFLVALFQLASALVKAGVIYLTIRVVARALPQLRQDQMTELCWRVLTPVGALCLIGELIWVQIFNGGTP